MKPEAEPLVPVSLSRQPDGGLEIGWSDGQQQRVSARQLQDHCPCATCREKRGAEKKPGPALNILKSEQTAPLTIDAMDPVGNYAYSITFSHGCGKGIYTFELLRGLGELSAAD